MSKFTTTSLFNYFCHISYKNGIQCTITEVYPYPLISNTNHTIFQNVTFNKQFTFQCRMFVLP